MMGTLNIIGSISNGVAAIAAVIAIIVTIWHYRSDKKEQKQERVAEKKGILFKESVIDFWLNKVSEESSLLNHELLQLSKQQSVTVEELQRLYRRMRNESQIWLYEMDIIKVFNVKLYNDVKGEVEKIVDTYSNILSKSLEQGKVSNKSTVEINRLLIGMRKKIYNKYLSLA